MFSSINKRRTKSMKLLCILKDGKWHSTKELAHRIGHTFGYFIFKLRKTGYEIQRQGHPRKRYQHQYRLIPLTRVEE